MYKTLIANGAAPSVDTIAERFALTPLDARRALQRLHNAHALVLEENGGEVLMANPLSAVPTDYRVTVDDVAYYANCAWDSLGIPAMLESDARIEARHPLTGEIIRCAVTGGALHNGGGGLVHFAHPFREWYDNIVDT